MLQAKNLTKDFNGRRALNALNLFVDKGEIYCLLGQNGAGKTTAINIFLGFVDATSGEALINGSEVKSKRREINRMIAYIPEVVQLYGNLSGVENLDFFSRLAGFTYTDDELKKILTKAGQHVVLKIRHAGKIECTGGVSQTYRF